MFQFLHGTIKRALDQHVTLTVNVCFNSFMVQLKVRSCWHG